jgi:alpha-glucosidase (family GH31 glycosyl hydrolase)
MEKRYDFSTEKQWNFKKFSPEPYWKKNIYPKTEAHHLFIGRMHDLGYKLALWLCVEYDNSIMAEDEIAVAAGKEPSGQEHWMDHLMNFVDQGIDGFKIDPARTIDEHPDFNYYNGKTDKEMHNLNQVLMPKQFTTTYKNHKKNHRPFVHYTSGWAGTQHWSASTSGDNGGGRTALFDQINLGMTGALNTSCDIMSVEKDLEMSSLHFGVFLPWMQINSWYSLRHPFYMNKKKEQTYKEYIKLRYALQPYVYSAAIEGAQTGMPIVRSMPLMFPEDRNCDDMVFQFMFGQNYLVSIFSDSIYLPKGNWVDYWTDEIIAGGRQIKHNIPSGKAGLLFVREGSIIPQQHDMQFCGEMPLDTLRLKVYPSNYCEYTLREDDGISYDYEKGKVATTKFECKKNRGGIELVVNPTEGNYDGCYESRTYEVEILLPNQPKEVLVDNKKISDWEYKNGKVYLTVSQPNVREKIVVSIK